MAETVKRHGEFPQAGEHAARLSPPRSTGGSNAKNTHRHTPPDTGAHITRAAVRRSGVHTRARIVRSDGPRARSQCPRKRRVRGHVADAYGVVVDLCPHRGGSVRLYRRTAHTVHAARERGSENGDRTAGEGDARRGSAEHRKKRSTERSTTAMDSVMNFSGGFDRSKKRSRRPPLTGSLPPGVPWGGV